MRVRKSRSEWLAIIRAFERSGESQAEFCAGRGVNLGSFRGWLYRLRKTGGAAPEVALVPVMLTEVASSASESARRSEREIIVAVSDVQVRVVAGTDVGYVAALVVELRARC